MVELTKNGNNSILYPNQKHILSNVESCNKTLTKLWPITFFNQNDVAALVFEQQTPYFVKMHNF